MTARSDPGRDGPLHIAFVHALYPPNGPTGGAEATLRFLARRLTDRGHRCEVITLTPTGVASTGEVDGIPVHYLPLANVLWPYSDKRPRLLRPLFQAFDAYNPVMQKRLEGKLRSLRPDVVHAHNLQGFSISAWVAAACLEIPLVQTLHDYYVACPRSTMWTPGRGNCATPCPECRAFALPRRRFSHLPTAVTSVSRRVLDRVHEAGVLTTPKARIVRGNNPTDELAPPKPRNPQDKGLRLGFLGRLDPVKGIENLFDALASLPAEAVRLAVAGRGKPEYEAALRRRVAPGTTVEFLGHVRPESFFPEIDLLVVPSVWEDPFPRVWHEALQYGVPALVTPLGGLPEAIEHGRTGFVAPSADAEGLRAALKPLLAGNWNPEEVRATCLEAAAAYAPKRIVDQYEAVLRAAARAITVPEWAGEAYL